MLRHHFDVFNLLKKLLSMNNLHKTPYPTCCHHFCFSEKEKEKRGAIEYQYSKASKIHDFFVFSTSNQFEVRLFTSFSSLKLRKVETISIRLGDNER